MTAQNLPDELSYTAEHEWIDVPPGARAPAGAVRIGLSSVAVDALGEIVYVDLPEPGAALVAGEPCGEVESTKSVSELFSPATGRVVAVNPDLADDPGLVSADPFGAGWLFTATVDALGNVLTADEYRAANEAER
jgi:glycine cleavage system H protein